MLYCILAHFFQTSLFIKKLMLKLFSIFSYHYLVYRQTEIICEKKNICEHIYI